MAASARPIGKMLQAIAVATGARFAPRRKRVPVPGVAPCAATVLWLAVESRKRNLRVTGSARRQHLALRTVRAMTARTGLLRAPVGAARLRRVALATGLVGRAAVRLVAIRTGLMPARSRRVLARVTAPTRRRLRPGVRLVTLRAARMPRSRRVVLGRVTTPAVCRFLLWRVR